MKKRKLLPIILFIFFSGLFIRLYEISSIPPGLYTDELSYLLSAYVQLHGLGSVPFSNMGPRNVVALLYYSLNGYSLSIFLFGLGNFSARLPVALFSSAMIFPIYLVSKEYLQDENVGILAGILWEFSPASFVMARWGDGVEFFPLFLFLFIIYFTARLIHHRNVRLSLTIMVLLSLLSVYIASISVWILIPLGIFFVSLVGYLLALKSRNSKRWNGALYLYIIFFIVAVDIFVSFPNLVFNGPLKYLAIAQVNPQYYLFYMPYDISFPQFFVRLFIFISPTKLFILPGVTSQSVGIQQVLIPFALWYLLIPFYATSFYIIFKTLRRRISLSYTLMIILFLAGFIQPVLNISNPTNSLEPAEAIFADPFLMIISSIGIVMFVRFAVSSLDFHTKYNFSDPYVHKLKILYRHRKGLYRLSALAVVLLTVSASVMTSIFFSNYFTSYGQLQENSEGSIFYTSYGLQQTGNFLVAHNLTDNEIFFVPTNGGGVNFSNSGVFNYWVYNLHFPSAWFYIYTHQKVRSVHVLRPGTLPDPKSNNSIVISQNASYGNLLSANGFSYRLIYSLNRSAGTAAIRIYQILPNTTFLYHKDLIYNVVNFTGFHDTNISFSMNESFSAILFLHTVGKPQSADLLYSRGYGLDIGVRSAYFFPWLGLPKDTLVPYNNLYSRIQSGNYSVPYSWYQFAGNSPLQQGSSLMISVTYKNDLYSSYINDTLIGKEMIVYPVLIKSLTFQVPSAFKVNSYIFGSALPQGYIYDLWNSLSYEHHD